MSYDPSQFEARRRALTSNYAAQGAMNAYQRFLSQQRGQRDLSRMNEEYDRQSPRVVSSFGRRGLVGPGVKSGAFRKAMSEFARNRMRSVSEAQQDMDQGLALSQLEERQLREGYQSDLLDMESVKSRQIEQDALELLRMRAGGY
jgi:hypothetical protein